MTEERDLWYVLRDHPEYKKVWDKEAFDRQIRFDRRFRLHPRRGSMKYVVVTRTVQVHETEIELDFGPLVNEKQADALVRQGARRGMMAEQMKDENPKLVSSKTNVSSIKRAGKNVWGNVPTAAKIEDAEKKAPVADQALKDAGEKAGF